MKTLIYFFIILLGLNNAISAEKVYTEEEFNKKLKEELEKNLKRLGRSGIIDLSNELLSKEQNISLKSLQVEKREQELELTRKDFEGRLKEFQDRQKKYLACLEDTEKTGDKRVSHMVEVISGMRPQNAADILSVQDSEITVKILGMLDPDKVSKIFNLMDKEISARLQKQYMTMKR
jgi:flagellar motility protein MotE (MotC chaperone)